MRTSRCDWEKAERNDFTALWVMIAGIVISTGRFSRVRSATTSLRAVASRRRSLTSSEGRGTRRVAGQALLAGLKKVFRPPIVEVLGNPFAAAQFGDALFAAQAFQHDTDLLLGRILLARRPADVADDLLGRILRRIGMLSHLRSFERYDEPETIPSSIRPICLMSADGGQLWVQLLREKCCFTDALIAGLQNELSKSTDPTLDTTSIFLHAYNCAR